MTTTATAVLADLDQPCPPDTAVLAGLALISRHLWATQTSPGRADGTALAQLHVALAQDELAPLGAPGLLDPDDEVDIPALLRALGGALRRSHQGRRLASLLVAARHVEAAASVLATTSARP